MDSYESLYKTGKVYIIKQNNKNDKLCVPKQTMSTEAWTSKKKKRGLKAD